MQVLSYGFCVSSESFFFNCAELWVGSDFYRPRMVHPSVLDVPQRLEAPLGNGVRRIVDRNLDVDTVVLDVANWADNHGRATAKHLNQPPLLIGLHQLFEKKVG